MEGLSLLRKTGWGISDIDDKIAHVTKYIRKEELHISTCRVEMKTLRDQQTPFLGEPFFNK